MSIPKQDPNTGAITFTLTKDEQLIENLMTRIKTLEQRVEILEQIIKELIK